MCGERAGRGCASFSFEHSFITRQPAPLLMAPGAGLRPSPALARHSVDNCVAWRPPVRSVKRRQRTNGLLVFEHNRSPHGFASVRRVRNGQSLSHFLVRSRSANAEADRASVRLAGGRQGPGTHKATYTDSNALTLRSPVRGAPQRRRRPGQRRQRRSACATVASRRAAHRKRQPAAAAALGRRCHAWRGPAAAHQAGAHGHGAAHGEGVCKSFSQRAGRGARAECAKPDALFSHSVVRTPLHSNASASPP